MNSSENIFATPTTRFLEVADEILFLVGDKVTGDSCNYIYRTGYGRSSIWGGASSDSIFASNNDYVEGGDGVDYFFYAGSYQIADYNFDEGDRIVATKLSQNVNISPSNVEVFGNKIAVADGATLTLGSNYDGGSVSAAIVNEKTLDSFFFVVI